MEVFFFFIYLISIDNSILYITGEKKDQRYFLHATLEKFFQFNFLNNY